MNHKIFDKLNDRKRRIKHEYEQGKDYFMETSQENFINPNNFYNTSLYQNFVNETNDSYNDESLNEKNSPKY